MKVIEDELWQAILTLLENNGGYIDGYDEKGMSNTIDGQDYFLVVKEDFERLQELVNGVGPEDPKL